jgi:hypothetical protein
MSDYAPIPNGKTFTATVSKGAPDQNGQGAKVITRIAVEGNEYWPEVWYGARNGKLRIADLIAEGYTRKA